MKRCPECRRDYYDDSLMYCLDDGTSLVEGPSSLGGAETAVLPHARPSSETATRTFDEGVTKAASRRNSIIAGVIGVILVTALGVSSYLYYGRGSTKQIGSIAVMPFTNDTGDPDVEYLSDGMTETLINSLSRIPSLSVKARSSVFSYKGKEVSPQTVAKELSVQAVLNGRVSQRGDQMVLNVELVDAATGDQIWGDRYTRKMTDILQLQSEIARDVSGKLTAKLTGGEQQKVTKNYTENTEAYQLYLRGRYHWNKRTPDDIKKSIEYFQQAIDRDPTYAVAYAALAEAYILIPAYGVGASKEYYPKARAAASKAIEMDPTLAEPHNAMASVLSNYDWKFAEAEAEWRKALELNANYATAHQWYAEHMGYMGRYEEALAEIRQARETDPLSLIINGLLGNFLRLNGRNGEALDQLQKTLEMDPNFPRTHLFLAEYYQQAGQYEEAVDEFAKHFILLGRPVDMVTQRSAMIKNRYRASGPQGYARAWTEMIESDQGGLLAPPAIYAGYLAHAGEIDKAFAILEKAYNEHDDTLLWLKDPRMDPLKSDPRYKDLLRRVGLPD